MSTEGLETTAADRENVSRRIADLDHDDGTHELNVGWLASLLRDHATLTARLAAAEAALAKLRERYPEPNGVVEEPPRDNSITDAW